MLLVVIVLSVLTIIIGLYGVVAPSSVMAFASRWRSRAGHWTASLARILFGVALWWVAPASRAPLALQVLAVITFVSGIAFLLMGHSRYESFLDWWSSQSSHFVRVWCLVAVIFGAFVLWSVIV